MIPNNKREIIGPISNPNIRQPLALEPSADQQLQSVYTIHLTGASRLCERNSFAFESPRLFCSSASTRRPLFTAAPSLSPFQPPPNSGDRFLGRQPRLPFARPHRLRLPITVVPSPFNTDQVLLQLRTTRCNRLPHISNLVLQCAHLRVFCGLRNVRPCPRRESPILTKRG
jgi:hypothetical protein